MHGEEQDQPKAQVGHGDHRVVGGRGRLFSLIFP